MESTRSIDDHLHQHGRSTTGDVPAGSKSKYGSHKSLSATNSTSSLSIDGGGGAGHRRSHPSLSSRYSTSDSRLSHSSDNVNNPHQKRGGSRSKRRLPRLDLSLDSKPKGFQPGRHDPNSTLESTEDEDRTSADEYSTEDDADSSLRSGDGDGKHGGGDQHQALNSSVSSATSYVDKAVEELIATERTYVRDLHDVIQGYMQHVAQIADTVAGKVTTHDYTILFGNIQSLYEFNREFLCLLEQQCGDAVSVAQCFLDCQQDFIIYSDYCTNFPQSVEVLERWAKDPILLNMLQRQQIVLGHTLPLGTYLCKPVQRILKYHLLLKNIQSYHPADAEGHEVIEEASETMIDVAMRINEIKRQHERWLRAQEVHNALTGDHRVDVVELGDLVLEDVFRVIGNWGERNVFLFRKAFIISKKRKDGFLQVKVIIKTSNLMLIESISREPLQFHVLPFDAPKVRHALQAKSLEQKQTWCQEIKKLMIESCERCIPDRAKELVLGTQNTDDRHAGSRHKNRTITPDSRTEKCPNAERMDDSLQRSSKTMSERRTRRRSTGAIKHKGVIRQQSADERTSNEEILKSASIDDSAAEAEADRDASVLTPTNLHSISPNDSQNLGASELDVEASLYRPAVNNRQSSENRASKAKARRSQSLDDVRTDDITDDNVATGSEKTSDDDVSMNGNGDAAGLGRKLSADREEIEVRLGNFTISDDDELPSTATVSETATETVRVIPVVRASSFKEAMRGGSEDEEMPEQQQQQPELTRILSQPPPSTTANPRDSLRSSWVMPTVFPSLEEIFNEWFTSAAKSRTGSLASSSSTPRARPLSDASSPLAETHGVQMRRSSRNSSQTSPLNTPEFHDKHLSRLFNWQPTHLGPISGSSDSLDSVEKEDDWVSDFSRNSRLPPGFETGFFDRDFGIRPPLLSRISQPFDSRISRQVSDSVFGNSSVDTHKTAKISSEFPRSQSGSTSRVIPVKVVSNQPSADTEAAKTGVGGSRTKSEDACDLTPVSEHKTLLSSTHSSQFSSHHDVRLPAGFLTGSGATSISRVSDTSAVNRRSNTDIECNVRVIPVTQERNPGRRDAQPRKQHGTRGRVIPVMVQSSVSAHGGNPTNIRDDVHGATHPASSWTSETGSVRVPVTVVQSKSGSELNSSASSMSQSDRPTVGKYLPLCYDDEEGEAVKKILQEMTIRRLPIRDTVRLINMKPSRSMDFLDSGQREVSASGSTQNVAVDSPTVDLLPVGFWVGNSAGTNRHQSSTGGAQTVSVPVTSSLIRKRLHQFGGDVNS